MPEPVLDVTLETARVLPPDEIPALELVERGVDDVLVGDRGDDVAPEGAPDDRGREERLLAAVAAARRAVTR